MWRLIWYPTRFKLFFLAAFILIGLLWIYFSWINPASNPAVESNLVHPQSPLLIGFLYFLFTPSLYIGGLFSNMTCLPPATADPQQSQSLIEICHADPTMPLIMSALAFLVYGYLLAGIIEIIASKLKIVKAK